MPFMVVWLLCSVVSIGYPPDAQADKTAEYTLKGAFLYNFALFTSWPGRTAENFNLCIYGRNPFSQDLDLLMKKKSINERKVLIHRIDTVDQLDQCQLVFISQAAIGHLSHIIGAVKDKPVLTVTDSPGAGRQGAVLNMSVIDDKVTFEANLIAARKAGLNLSSQLLRLATEVHQ
ncbi:MAG: YfiR family protein [Betaproteobacteria bacterium]|nr:YfiR family protein [Betaproteobacteria bacterium]